MTRFLSCIKGSLVVASIAAVTMTAQAAEPCDLGTLVPGETYSFPTYTEVRGEYTPSVTGPVKFLYSGSPLTLYTSDKYEDDDIVDGDHSYVDGKQLVSYKELQEGKKYYLYSRMTMMASTLLITEGTMPLEVVYVSPTLPEGETFSVSSNYTIDVGFNVPVTVGNTLLLANGERTRVTSTISNSYVVCDVATSIMTMYRNGTIKGGDTLTLRLVNVVDKSDSDNKYGDKGLLEIDFVMADKPAELVEIVNADQLSTQNPFLSYYMQGDENGVISFVFDKPVNDGNAVAKITYGDTDNLDVGVYNENIPGVAKENTVSFDFSGKLRRPIDMLPLSTPESQPTGMNIMFGNIYTEDGQRVYTGRQSNPTGFSLSFRISTIQYTISSDFTPGRGSKLTAGNEMEIWVMNGSFMNCAGVKFDYVSGGQPASTIVPMSDIKTEPDPVVAEDMIFTFPIPKLNVDIDTNVTVSFDGLEFGDGLDHSKELTAEFVYDSSAGVEDIEFVHDDKVTVYNAAGICILKNADKEALRSLPSGLYIVNGKKIIF